MVRNYIFRPGSGKGFHNRGKEIFRIEALSDAVFAFSVSLLVASLEVPKTFAELKSISAGAIPFFATVVMIFSFWYKQYVFFRRYGLNDFKIILLNLAYLAVILFYVYPLKFLFTILISYWSGISFVSTGEEASLSFLSGEEFPQLIMLFSIGYVLIWALVYLMHRHVLRLSQSFDFSYYELQFTKFEARGALWNVMTGTAALLFALFRQELLASLSYIFIPVIMLTNEYFFRRTLNKEKMNSRRKHTFIRSGYYSKP